MKVLGEVKVEQVAQLEKWGEQNHPMLDQRLLNRPGGCDALRMAQQYEIPSEPRAKFLLELSRDQLTYMHILIEEVAEAVACLDDKKAMRAELVQVAAVAVSMVEAIDRRALQEGE